MPRTHRVHVVTIAALLLTAAATARAQCERRWSTPNGAMNATNGPIGTILDSTLWDPDGAGPLRPLLVVSHSIGAGRIGQNEVQFGNAVNTWDGATWVTLGSNIGGHAYDLLVDVDGRLLVFGDLTVTSQSLPVSCLGASWTGLEWAPLQSPGSGPAGFREAIIRSSGEILVGGRGLFRKNGDILTRITPPSQSDVRVASLVEMSDGRVVVGGSFAEAGGVVLNNIAIVDGEEWLPLGGGFEGFASDMVLDADGSIVVGGGRRDGAANPIGQVARWRNGVWTSLTSDDTNGDVVELTTLADGSILASGSFTRIDGVAARRVARFDGETWSPVGHGIGPTGVDVDAIFTVTPLSNGDIFAAGQLTSGTRDFSFFTSPCFCPADLDDNGDLADGGRRDDAVDINDLLYFLTGFEAGAVAVDLDDDGDPTAGHPDGAVTIEDLLFFVARFELGC